MVNSTTTIWSIVSQQILQVRYVPQLPPGKVQETEPEVNETISIIT